MNTDVLFSSAKLDWRTPTDLYHQLDKEFGFTVDAAATEGNKLCGSYFGPDHEVEECRDGLIAPWHGVMWCNPPYGRNIGKWVLHAARQRHARNTTSVLLVPARTDTQWWKHAQSADEIRFIEGRVHFWMPVTHELLSQARVLAMTYGEDNPKDIAKAMKVPLVAVQAAFAGKSIAEEAAPFPSALLVFKGWQGSYRWWRP